jgi:hypothetical protein
MFLTTIFNQKLCNQYIAWHPLGYIYDLSIDELVSIHYAQMAHLKNHHLHAILNVILETLVAQSPNALDGIELTLGDVKKQ